MAAPKESRSGRRLGLRREVLILLPVSLLVLVVLSTFTLFSFRNALQMLGDERRAEAAQAARSIADYLAVPARLPTPVELRRLAPAARSIVLVDSAGLPLLTSGELPVADPLGPVAGEPLEEPLGVGPDGRMPDTVAGFAPLGSPAGRRYVRVDLPAEVLGRQSRAVQILTVVVLAINSSLVLLVLVFLRHLLAPYETLLARAREMGELEPGQDGDEIEMLLATFDRALGALASREAARTPEEDIEALERTLSASLQSGLLLLDREGRVLALNAVGAELLGVQPPEPGTPLAEVLTGQPELLEVLGTAVAEGASVQRQEHTVRSGGGTLTVGVTVHPLRRDAGGIRGYLVLFADLTEVLRQAEESRLAESLARLAEMAGGVAHELRNSLATLRGYLTLIERRPDEESVADFLSEIRHEADHLERVLNDFLTFARPGSARIQEISLARLLPRVAADPALGGFPVQVSGAGEAPYLRGDAQLLERALRNLLHNAVQAEREAGQPGPVEISLAVTSEGVEVAIEDRGPGLPPEIRERLFHPFATSRRGGVGLGLALAHRIVTLHGGRIRLDDRSGGGTRALLAFPSDTIVTMSNRDAASEEPEPGRANLT